MHRWTDSTDTPVRTRKDEQEWTKLTARTTIFDDAVKIKLAVVDTGRFVMMRARRNRNDALQDKQFVGVCGSAAGHLNSSGSVA